MMRRLGSTLLACKSKRGETARQEHYASKRDAREVARRLRKHVSHARLDGVAVIRVSIFRRVGRGQLGDDHLFFAHDYGNRGLIIKLGFTLWRLGHAWLFCHLLGRRGSYGGRRRRIRSSGLLLW